MHCAALTAGMKRCSIRVFQAILEGLFSCSSFTRVQRSVTEGCHLIGRIPAPSVKGNFEARSHRIDFVVQRGESLLFGIAGNRVTASLAVDEQGG